MTFKILCIFVTAAFTLLLSFHGIFAVVCTKEKKRILPVFMAAITFNAEYLKNRIDFDRFIGLIHMSNLIFSCMSFAIAVIACCLK